MIIVNYWLLPAILPGLFLVWYIYKKDKVEKEPVKLLAKLMVLGAVSALPVILVEMIMEPAIEIISLNMMMYLVLDNFIGVALVEELFKFLALKLGSWKNPAFNYKFDGVVYGVCTSLGFAILENIMYVADGGISVALLRAVTAVPGHAIFGVFMGQYYGMAKQCENKGDGAGRRRNLIMAVVVPTFLHGAYDLLASLGGALSGLLFFGFVIVLDIMAIRNIKRDAATDEAI